jgi:hypothetical protein
VTEARLAAPGPMNVDWEEWFDFGPLREYRLGRARAALEASELGALLVFDMNSVRCLTSTHIGEWARDKLITFALLTRDSEPVIWGFGSAAKHHRLYCQWLDPANSRAGLNGLRGAVAPDAGLFRRTALEIKWALDEAGVGGQPLGVDTTEGLKPGVRENEIVALATKTLYEFGSDDVEAINAIFGERCSPQPHNFSHRLIRSGDQAFFVIIQAYNGYRTCYCPTFNVGRATPRSATPTPGRANGWTRRSRW